MKEKITDKSNLLIMGLAVIIILLGVLVYEALKKEEQKQVSDAIKFASEYTQVPEDNLYVYRTSDEIIRILENGTGVVLLGFPECPWCQRYAVYLNEVAEELGFEKIYYYNILEDRKNNSETYQKIINILTDYLQYDEEGNKKVYVPSVIGLNKGKIVGFNDETAWDSKGFETPEEYWNEETVTNLKNTLSEFLLKANENMCTSCNEE